MCTSVIVAFHRKKKKEEYDFFKLGGMPSFKNLRS